LKRALSIYTLATKETNETKTPAATKRRKAKPKATTAATSAETVAKTKRTVRKKVTAVKTEAKNILKKATEPAEKAPAKKTVKAKAEKAPAEVPVPDVKEVKPAPKAKSKSKAKNAGPKLRVIPLGGLGEVGKNMTLIETDEDILIIDAGMSFPEEDMLGIDIVIPDMAYLYQNRSKVRGVVLTHGHEDHVGSLPYLLRELNVPVYGTGLTLGLLRGKLEELKLTAVAQLHEINPREAFAVGGFTVEAFRVNHSIPDAVGYAITTPVGVVVHTGDFKLDQTPVDGRCIDFHRIAEYGDAGVLLLLSDSTNAERSGFTPSEMQVGGTISDLFSKAKGRIIVATFSSNVHRIQQVVDAAVVFGRKVAVSGRSMENMVEVSRELGYLNCPDNTIVSLDEADRYPASQIVICTTGSQGEPLSALTRMSLGIHRRVKLRPEDTVLISATPVPGNEKMVARTINNLFRLGVTVVYGSQSGVHVSGHGSQEELKMMLNLVRPKFFMPVHGEYRHLAQHRKLAMSVGIDKENIFLLENGQVLQLTEDKAQLNGRVTAGKTFIDGSGVGDVGSVVLKDRKLLSEEGILVVSLAMDTLGNILGGPEIVSRGFVYMREAEEMMDQVKELILATVESAVDHDGYLDMTHVKNNIRQDVAQFLYERTKRRPLILPVILEV